jgi:hypothetical protein
LESIIPDLDRATSTVLYDPSYSARFNSRKKFPSAGPNVSAHPSAFEKAREGGRVDVDGVEGGRGESNGEGSGDVLTRTVPIPSGMVGCIMGKGGSFIKEIRRISGCRITISPSVRKHGSVGDGNGNGIGGEKQEEEFRSFSVTGDKDGIEKAFNMLYNKLDDEKERIARERDVKE